MKKISIIIPAYNAEKYIDRCLNSIFSQKGAELEVIVVNDGSTDNTYEILLGYGDRITLINKENGGVASARNDALAVCTGEYVIFLDCDDYLPENTFSYYIDICTECDPDIIRGNYKVVFDDRTMLPQKRMYRTELIDKNRFKTEVYPHFITDILLNTCCASLIKREMISTEFRKDMRTGEDAVFMINVYSNAKNVYFTDKIVYNYYQTGTGLTGTGLTVWKKFLCNCVISQEILRKLKEWNMFNPLWIIRACIRPIKIIFSKLKRVFGDAYEKG